MRTGAVLSFQILALQLIGAAAKGGPDSGPDSGPDAEYGPEFCLNSGWRLTPHGLGLAETQGHDRDPNGGTLIRYDTCEVPEAGIPVPEYCRAQNAENQAVVLTEFCKQSSKQVCECAEDKNGDEKTGVSGDPFVVDQSGKRVQFFLPLRQEELLVSCQGMKLYGTAFTTEIPGDEQQWFNKIRITLGDQNAETLSVEIATNYTKPQDDEDITAVQPDTTLLQTVKVMVEGHHMTKTGSIGTDDAALIAVWATASQETVQLSYESIVLQIKSAVAQKFTKAHEQKMYTHLDLRFVELDTTKCTAGILAEIWGVVTMSQRTAAFLQPPKEHVVGTTSDKVPAQTEVEKKVQDN